MNLKRYYFERFLEKHKLVRHIYIAVIAIIGILVVIWIFSWNSLLSWIITKEKSELYAFIFWVIFAVVVLIAAIVTAIIICRKKNL